MTHASIENRTSKAAPRQELEASGLDCHASFSVGRVSESRGDKLDIDFVNGGEKRYLNRRH
jgi:hypothetical protein